MLFNSVTFLLFLFLVVTLYWFVNSKTRYFILFVSSLIFYGFWKYEYTLLLLISTFNDYFISLYIQKTNNLKIKKRLLIISLAVYLGLFFTLNT